MDTERSTPKFCGKCGVALEAGSCFCGVCGSAVGQSYATASTVAGGYKTPKEKEHCHYSSVSVSGGDNACRVRRGSVLGEQVGR